MCKNREVDYHEQISCKEKQTDCNEISTSSKLNIMKKYYVGRDKFNIMIIFFRTRRVGMHIIKS